MQEWRLKFGLPYVNSFTLNPESETRKSQTGWVGIEAGIEYQYNDRNYAVMEVSINGAAEVLGLLDIVGEFDRFTSECINISVNRRLNKLTIGYGVGLARNTWEYTRTFVSSSITPSRKLVKKSSINLGLMINSYRQLSKSFYIGVIYRPYFYKFSPETQFDYEHVISLDFMWKIGLFKKKV